MSTIRRKKRNIQAVQASPLERLTNVPKNSSDAYFATLLSDRNFNISTLKALRQLVRNSDLLQSYIKLIRTNVVGTTGATPNFTSISSKRDREKLIELWEDWSKDPTVRGKMSWSAFMQRIITTFVRDGRAFVVAKYDEDYNMGIGFDRIRREYLAGWSQTYAGIMSFFASKPKLLTIGGVEYYVVDGMAYKKNGRLKGYLFNKLDDYPMENNTNEFLYNQFTDINNATLVPTDLCADLAIPDDDNSVPEDMLSIARRVFELKDLDESNLKNARVASRKNVFITKNEGSIPVESQQSMEDDPDSQYETPLHLQDFEVEELPPGYDVTALGWDMPKQSVLEMRVSQLKVMASALGLDYATLAGDLEKVNYSSMRHGALHARDNYRMLQQALEDTVCGWILQTVVNHAVISGRVSLIAEKTMRELGMVTWRHRSWGWVDPLKDAMAYAHLVRLGVISPQRIASAMGVDAMQVLAENVEWAEKMEAAGLDFVTLANMSGTGKVVVETEADEEDNPNAEED